MLVKIDILNPTSIQNAIDELNNYKNDLKRKATEICSRLAEIGREVVETEYSQGYDKDFKVTCYVNGNSSMIVAEGSEVVFLEFGAGVYTIDTTEGNETEGLPLIEEGSWSRTEGVGQFTPTHRYWYYHKQRFVGIHGTHGFYFASDEIKERAIEEARKVFNDDRR